MLAVKVLAFDTGGTILDWHSGLVAALKDCGAARRRTQLVRICQRIPPPRVAPDDRRR
jgi:hypothetical protein